MTIGDEIPPEKFERLVQLYDVQVPDDVAKQYDTLKYLNNQRVLDLNELVKNLTTVNCLDQSEKVAEYIRETEQLMTPIPETEDQLPIQAVQRQLSGAAVFNSP